MTTMDIGSRTTTLKVARRHGLPSGLVDALWPPDEETVTVDGIEAEAASLEIAVDRGALVRFLKDLQELGYGRFVTGRRGHKSRFEWSLSILHLSEAGSVESTSDENQGAEPPEIITHTFVLRSNYTVSLGLPSDLTAAEARRLSMFIASLPFDGGDPE